ncbi:hypothetical protein NDU88_006743 [Pleurodeles waltl]|uniref:Uncharacterized protein n=1 Tax=Pleurodeles waltl TaxID=8319 RepID=A0AAV7TZ66_PLEWA|nr:hypothetical protein NDU88_006743 [Pleurodeles waltl]
MKPLNYRAWDVALCKARKLGELCHNGPELLLYPDFTQQVQQVRRQFILAKCKLQVEYSMLYPALQVIADGKATIFGDPKNMQQLLKRRTMTWYCRAPPRLEDLDATASQDLEELE